MRIAAYVLIALNTVLWAAALYVQIVMFADAYTYGGHRNPTAGEILLLAIPVLILLVSICRPMRNFREGRLNLGVCTLTATLVLLPFYILFFLF